MEVPTSWPSIANGMLPWRCGGGGPWRSSPEACSRRWGWCCSSWQTGRPPAGWRDSRDPCAVTRSRQLITGCARAADGVSHDVEAWRLFSSFLRGNRDDPGQYRHHQGPAPPWCGAKELPITTGAVAWPRECPVDAPRSCLCERIVTCPLPVLDWVVITTVL